MTASFYDVAVIGAELPSLLCGALLARRGFRVVVLEQDSLPPTYRVGEHALPRAPFLFDAAGSPIARRVLSELAVHQLVRRRARAIDPAMQIALPDHRIDLPLDDARLEREIEREFPEIKRPIDDFHRYVASANEDLDRLVERDLVWPPETFFERRELSRAAAHQRFDKHGDAPDPLGELPSDHPFRKAVALPAGFASAMEPSQLAALARVRLYRAWLRGSASLEGGYDWLHRTLVDKIRAYAGEVRGGERADRIEVERGSVSAVTLAGSGERIGCSFVVAGCELPSLLRLLPSRAPFEGTFERIGEPQPRYYRYTLNLVVRAEGVPVGMARDVFFLRDADRPMQADNVLHVEAHPADDRGRRLVCVETLLPRGPVEEQEGYRESLRERVLGSLARLAPFMDRHVELIDSPHDGRDVQLTGGTLQRPPDPWQRGPDTMRAVYGYPVRGTLGVCALPVRAPIKRLLFANAQVVPGLGTEGRFLAAWSAARIVTKSDRKKEWMRRGLWTKVEI